MSIMQESKSFGMIDLPRNVGPCFRVWQSNYECVTVPTGQYPTRAMWQGDSIIVEFETAPTRVYHDVESAAYNQIY
jgi:hypothetical protein